MGIASVRQMGPVRRLAAAALLFATLVSCTKKDKGQTIVIPPGQQVEYSNNDFLPVSKAFYSVELQKFDTASFDFYSISDITPPSSKDSPQTIRYIMPRDKNDTSGAYVLKVSLPRLGISYNAIVIPDRVTTPSLTTHLAYELLKNYPKFRFDEAEASAVIALEELIDKKLAAQRELHPAIMDPEMDVKALIKFYQNALAVDADILKLADDMGLEFDVSGGVVVSEPFPFGAENHFPKIDAANSTSTDRNVIARETEELIVKGKAYDGDNDFILYSWKLETGLTANSPKEFHWTPDYDASRSATYKLELNITDGGQPQVISWNVEVLDRNRPPETKLTCPASVHEGELITCKLTAFDFDGDALNFTLSDKNTSSRVTINGQNTDDTTRKRTVSGVGEVTMQITPNNFDAKKRTVYFDVTVDDGKLGQVFVPASVQVIDINEPPRLMSYNGSPIIPFVPGDVPREWDRCADVDPDGGQPFRFYLEIRDPDNQPEAGPRSNERDTVTVQMMGLFADTSILKPITNADNPACPASQDTDPVVYRCYEWRPSSYPRSGQLQLVMKDDHGGSMTIPNADSWTTPIVLASEDRNVLPCMVGTRTISNGPSGRPLAETNPSMNDSFGLTDDDGVAPIPELAGIPLPVMPLLATPQNANVGLVFKKTYFNPNEWVSRFAPGDGGESAGMYSINFQRAVAGSVKFERTAPHTSAITIPKGYKISTTGTNPRIKYETAQAVTLDANDLGVIVPIVAINRTVPVNKLNTFLTLIPGATVTNPTALTGSGTVRVTRVSGSAVTIPAGAVIGTNEVVDGSDTVRYETLDNVTITTSQTFLDIRVRRQSLTVPANQVNLNVDAALPGPALTISNPVAALDSNTYSLVQAQGLGVTNNVDRFTWSRRGADGAVLPVNTFLTAVTAAPAGWTFKTDADLGLEGWLRATRIATGAVETILQNTELKTTDGTRYVVSYNTSMAAGVSTVLLPVRRTKHLNALPFKIDIGTGAHTLTGDQIATLGWSDTNYPPTFLNPAFVKVLEGSAVTDFKFEVTDNTADPAEPKDFLDRHIFTWNNLTSAPAGPVMFCRNPADNTADISTPACVPCNDPTIADSLTYFEAATCYLRFKPGAADIAKTFSINATANDRGITNPAGSNVRSNILNIIVVEINDPPVFTDIAWSPLGNGTVATAATLGEFVEGTSSSYRFYLTDPDRGSEQKTLVSPTLVRTHKFISPAGWTVVPNPSGMSVSLLAASVPNSDGIGSKTTAQLVWNPIDYDAKRLAGDSGFVVELRSCDQGQVDSPQQCAIGFYTLKVRNINNIPATSLATTATITADTYAAFNIVTSDKDYYAATAGEGGFATAHGFCGTPGVFNCELDRTGWPAVTGQFDSPYSRTTSIASCQTAGTLTKYKVPWMEGVNTVGSVSSNVRSFSFSFRWCPQRMHIGTHNIYLNLADNGDQDFRGVSSAQPASGLQLPLALKVIAPVFFESPRKNTAGVVDLWMQQAFSLIQYNYELKFNNSRGNLLRVDMLKRALVSGTAVGNPQLVVRRLTDNVALRSSATVVTNVNTATERVVLEWKPYGANDTTNYYSTADQLTWPEFQLKVTDQSVTAETDTVGFRVQVKNFLSPPNNGPVISAFWPATSTVSVPEQIAQSFSVTASDANGDYLHYRWYLDGLLVWDSGNSYSFTPKMDDAFLPAATPGVHSLVVQVTDGYETVKASQTWSVKVRNTVPLPQRMTYMDSARTPWHLQQAIQTRYASITNLNWGPTVPIPTTSGANSYNSLVMTGSYTRASQTKHFVLRLPFTNGVLADTVATDAGILTELLPWATGRKSEQVSYRLSSPAALLEILVGSLPTPDLSFAASTDGVKLNPALNSIASLTTANACTGSCAYNFFRAAVSNAESVPNGTLLSAGTLPSASYMNGGNIYYFFSPDGASISWNRAGSTADILTVMTGNYQIGDIAVSTAAKRLYFTSRDPATQSYRLHVYSLSAVASGVVSPVTTLNITDGVNPDNRLLDLAVDETGHKVYGLLPGTGGVVALNDDGLSTPTNANLSFIGVPNIGSSLTDQVGDGRKLVYNPTTQLLMGIAKDSSEVFIIDTISNNVKTFRTEVPLDEIIVFPNDGLTLGVRKPNPLTNPVEGRVYYIR